MRSRSVLERAPCCLKPPSSHLNKFTKSIVKSGLLNDILDAAIHVSRHRAVRLQQPGKVAGDYCLNANGGPLSRFPLRSTVTSTRSAILTKGIPLFIP